MTIAQVASAARIDVDLLETVEHEPTPIARGKVLELAKAFAVPVQFLFFQKLQIAPNLPDFRTAENHPAVLTSAGLARVARARSIISYLNDEVFDQERPKNIAGSIAKKDGVQNAAKHLSRYWRPIKRKDGSIDPEETFREVRLAIEREGTIVLCDSVASDGFRGFCFSETGNFPLILINISNQRPATKLFTLMHEMVHILLGQTGISDPNILENKVEQFCNRVSASVMMPADAFKEYFMDVRQKDIRSTINSLARYFGVSKSAAALRVLDLELAEDYYRRWLATLPPRIPLIEEEEEGEKSPGGGGIPTQVGRFGYRLPTVLGNAVKESSISVFDTYRLTNLSPKTFKRLAEIGAKKLEH